MFTKILTSAEGRGRWVLLLIHRAIRSTCFFIDMWASFFRRTVRSAAGGGASEGASEVIQTAACVTLKLDFKDSEK